MNSLISILGTNDYLECRHSFGNIATDEPVKYCQEDIVKFFCRDFDDNSEIRIFLTEDAEKKNWLNNGHIDRNNKQIPNIGLKERLEKLVKPEIIKPIKIKEGYNEKEIWEIFQVIFESFKEKEEVIVDITHSFRSLPMLMITLLNFAKQVKKIKVRGIYYAAFETLGSINEVRNLKPKERIAPILDLTSFSDLQDWTNATYDFIYNANVHGMKSLVKSSVNYSEKTNKIEKYIPSKVIESLNKLIDNIALCRGKELLEFNYSELIKNIDSLKEKELPKVFNYLIDEIKSKIQSFDNDPKKLTISIADWCVQHNLFQQAITMLQESSITVVLQENNLDYSDLRSREIVTQSFRIASQNIPQKDWKKPAADEDDIVNRLLKNELFNKTISVYNSLTEIRNDVNHSGFLNDARPVSSIKDRLTNILVAYKEIFQ